MKIKAAMTFHSYLKAILMIFVLFLFSCSKKNSFEVKDFKAITNYKKSEITNKEIFLDYTDAFTNGFVIPSIKQTSSGKFVFSFSVENNDTPKKYYYKIYYQNESYKFSEDHINSNENFYGSWSDYSKEFSITAEIPADGQFHEIIDSFNIAGNPRNEKIFYGTPPNKAVSDKDIIDYMARIKRNSEWYQSIIKKSKENNISVDDQLKHDAVYMLQQSGDGAISNQRWERNPRVGKYSFLIVITTQENIQKNIIPDYIRNITKKSPDSVYVNPFSFFHYTKSVTDIVVLKSVTELNVKAKIDLSKGLYIDPFSLKASSYSKENYNPLCGEDIELWKNAQLEEFTHATDYSTLFENIPIVADVAGGNYTKKDYNINPYNKEKSIKAPIYATNCPCKNAGYDSVTKSIFIKNPATKEGEWRKENVGIIARHGLTYGKYRVKVKLPELLNKDNLWNGLTNAIWLIHQSGEWNNRRPCEKEGYIPKVKPGKDTPRQKNELYTEIDIEIVKGARYWPKSSYKDGKKPEELISDSENVMVTATNWDLACPQPSKYSVGAVPFKHNKTEYTLHRWDDWYQALTTKYPASDDELFKSPYYYFEIEWKPTEIIWRMGPEKDKMKEFAYMDETVTSIPNNQMLLIITQEWHLSWWWPEAPFDQNRIPFPSKDIIGHIYEIEVE